MNRGTRLAGICLTWLGMIVPLAAQTAASNSATTTSASSSTTTVQVPRLIRLSGTLTPPPPIGGSSLVNVTFSLYQEETGGTALWQESQNVQLDSSGHYTVLLGSTQAEGVPIELFTSVQAQWLGVRPQGEAEQARIMLVSVPFALKAGDAETLGGQPPSAYAAAPSAAAAASGGTSAAAGPNAPASPSAKASPNALPCLGGPILCPPQAGLATANYVPLWEASSKTIEALGSSVIYQSGGNVGIGTTSPKTPLDVRTTTATSALSAQVANANGTTFGIIGLNNSTSTTTVGFGIAGLTSSIGAGVSGINTSTTGNAIGVAGSSNSSDGAGVFGIGHVGVQGQSDSQGGYGGVFINQSTSATPALNQPALALGAITGAPNGIAFNSIVAQGSVIAQQHQHAGVAVWGDTNVSNDTAVLGTVDDGTAVMGLNNNPSLSGPAGSFTNYATTGAGVGVTGTTNSPSGYGVYGVATSTDTSGAASGVYGVSSNAYGVYGYSTYNVGVLGVAQPSVDGSNGVAGVNNATSGHANGVYGISNSPGGVGAIFENTAGGLILLGRVTPAQNLFAVDGTGGGFFNGNLQVNGNSNFGGAVQVNGNGNFGGAVQVNGNLNVGGSLTKGGGSFKIDDPLDPANKYLSHSFVESPDMMNIYNGIIRLDARGEAWVELPGYFEALNRDFRYQLTSVGAPQPRLYIAREVKGNRFKIAGGKANAKVSWQVTGIRHDAWANAHRIPNEEDKPADKRGTYLHPELFGAGADRTAEAMDPQLREVSTSRGAAPTGR